MALEQFRTMTVEEYMQLEENDVGTLYEYEDGYAYAMAGGTADHDTIKFNLQRILWGLLRGSKCRTYTSDMNVLVTETRYYHPDVTVTCDSRDRGTTLVIRSPRVVIEVLSPTTEMTDRTRKLQYYCAHPTIEAYLLVDSRRLKAELYAKEDNRWIYSAFEGQAEIPINCLGLSFPLRAAYTDVELAENSSEEEDFAE